MYKHGTPVNILNPPSKRSCCVVTVYTFTYIKLNKQNTKGHLLNNINMQLYLQLASPTPDWSVFINAKAGSYLRRRAGLICAVGAAPGCRTSYHVHC